MKNRKLVIVAFLLAACMMLAIGYAALNESLEVDGTAEIRKDAAESVYDANIYFTNAEVLTVVADKNTTSINADNKDKVSFTAGSLAKVGDYVEFRYEVSNFNTDLAALLTTTLTANATLAKDDNGTESSIDPSMFTVTYEWDKTTVSPAVGDQPGKAYLTVRVTLNETPQSYIKGSFTLTIGVTSTDPQ